MTQRNFELTRPMGDYNIIQRTADGMFDANALLKQWNENNPNKQRRIDKFLNNKETKEFIEALVDDIQVSENQPNVKNDISTSVLKIVKPRGVKGGGRTEGAVWMHPLLFMNFAMYLNPRFKVTVLKMVADQLIEYRNKVADMWKEWNAMVARFGGNDTETFKRLARCLNKAVFGYHKEGMRDFATSEELREMARIQAEILQLIKLGYINNLKGVIKHLEKYFKAHKQITIN